MNVWQGIDIGLKKTDKNSKKGRKWRFWKMKFKKVIGKKLTEECETLQLTSRNDFLSWLFPFLFLFFIIICFEQFLFNFHFNYKSAVIHIFEKKSAYLIFIFMRTRPTVVILFFYFLDLLWSKIIGKIILFYSISYNFLFLSLQNFLAHNYYGKILLLFLFLYRKLCRYPV